MIHPDDMAPLATMADAHYEWHHNTGVPVGNSGCPWDACHPIEPGCYTCLDEDANCPECRPAEIACGHCKQVHRGPRRWVLDEIRSCSRP